MVNPTATRPVSRLLDIRSSASGRWSYWWLILGVTLLALQAAGALVFRSGGARNAYHDVVLFFFLLPLLSGAAVCALNAISNGKAIRAFWSFLAASFAFWALNQWTWVYYSVVRGMPLPPYLVSAVPLLLRIVFLTAAAGSEPHLESPQGRPYKNILNLLVLLFFFIVLFEFLRFPFPYADWDPKALLAREILYLAMNLTLFAGLGAALITAQGPWKAIYWHLLGASVLYSLGSLISNLAIAPGKYIAGLQDLGYTAAAYWFVWIALRGRESAPRLESARGIATPTRNYTGMLVILAMTMIPIVAVWELYRADEPEAARLGRMGTLVSAIVLTVFAGLLTLYIRKLRLTHEISVAHERLQMAVMSGRSVLWESDLKTGRSFWFGDLLNVFGIPSDTLSAQTEDLFRYIHPLDRERVADAIRDAQLNVRPYNAEFRIVQQDGAVRWVNATGKFHYTKKGDPLRMLGVAFDITDRKIAETARIKSEEKFYKAFFSSPMAIVLTSTRDHRYIDVNNTFEQLSGWRREEVLGRTPFDINLWVEPSGRHEIVKDLLKDGQRRLLEFRYRRKDGEQRVALGSAELIEIEGEACLLGASLDITELRRTQESLRESEEKFSKAFRSSPMAINLVSMRDHRFLDVNEGFEKMSGWSRDEVIGRTPLECNLWVEPSERERFLKQISAVGSTRDLEFRYRRKDGEQRVALGSAELIEIDGEPCLISANMDITERRRTEEALRVSEQRFRRVVEHIGDAVISDDLQGRITFANDRFLQLFGFTREQLHTVGLENYIAPEYLDELVDRHRRRIRGEDVPSHFEYQGVRTDGSRMWLEVDVVSITDAEGNLVGTQSALRDITQRKQAEEGLRESEERFRRVVEHIGDALAVDNVAGRVVFANDRFLNLFGLQSGEIPNIKLEDYVSPEYCDEVRDRHERRMRGEDVPTHFEYEGIRRDGARIWLEAEVVPIRDHDGNLVGSQKTLRDVTERKRAERALRDSEERLRHLVSSSNDWVWEVDENGIYTYAGPQCRGILGYEPSEIVGKSPFELMPEDESVQVAAVFKAIAAERKPFRGLRNVNLHKNGHRVVLETNGIPILDADGTFRGYRGTDRDITERDRAEHALRESEERFRFVANAAPVMIWMSDPSGACTYVNKAWLDFTGGNGAAELGEGWKERIHPDDLDAMWMKSNEGFEQRKTIEVQYRVKRHDGEYRWILDLSVPRFDPDGTFAGYIGSCIDITERKLAEEAMATIGRRLIEAQEVERAWIGRELHDDINQRLALLAVELDRCQEHALPNSEFQEKVSHAQNRIAEIAKDVQALSHRLHSSKLEYLGLATAASSFCREFSQHNQIHIDFTHEGVPRNLPQEVSLCLFRVLQEALQNASKYSGVRNFTVDLHGSPTSIELRVADQGVGFEEQDAFIQQGLGLISMRERLQLVHGEFSVKSKPGAGTTIYARVPLIQDNMRAMAG